MRTSGLPSSRAANMIRNGDQVFIRREFQDAGDHAFDWFAVSDEEKGRVDISPRGTGLTIAPVQTVMVSMLETQVDDVTFDDGSGTRVRIGATKYIPNVEGAVRVIDIDSDPSTLVHVVEVANPDAEHFVRRADLFDAADDAAVAYFERRAERAAEGR